MQSHQGLSFLPTGTILVLGLVLVTDWRHVLAGMAPYRLSQVDRNS